MKVSYNWLKSYIDISNSPSELADILTDLGLEVEGIEQYESVKGGYEGLVVGKVLECGKHPNADRLKLTSVDIGNDEPVQIVCGAPNVDKGQNVVVAQVGTTLFPTNGDSFTIKKGKIRGEVSLGMICAEDEIGIGDDHDGIMVLAEDYQAGTPIKEVFPIYSDTIYDVGLTPNRSDATSHIGVAKDILAYVRYHANENATLNLPPSKPIIKQSTTSQVEVIVEDHDACPRYSGVSLSNITIRESPTWIKNKLRAVGVKCINNVVDITNLVLHEFGQPLHAFDQEAIHNNTIVVRKATEGQEFITLDGVSRKLSSNDLLIDDTSASGLCIAGVYGGKGSGVTDTTTDIFLESAHFEAIGIRKTSMKHNLRTDAAKCYEKGTDPNLTITALHRAIDLLIEYADAKVVGEIIDIYPEPIKEQQIVVRTDKVNAVIGKDFTSAELMRLFNALDFNIVNQEGSNYTITVPTNKADVTREVDVIEELLRVYGFNNVELPTTMVTSLVPQEHRSLLNLRNSVSNQLVGRGFNEAMTVSLVESKQVESVYTNLESRSIKINNTSNTNLDIMRPDALVSMLNTFAYNINRQQTDVKLFEFAKTYLASDDGDINEREYLILGISGTIQQQAWNNPSQRSDMYRLHGYVLALLKSLGIDSHLSASISEDERYQYGICYTKDNDVVASLGKVRQSWMDAADVKEDIFYAEMDLNAIQNLWRKVNIEISEVSKYPAVNRDLAFVLDSSVKYVQLEKIIRREAGKLLSDIRLFDIYEDAKHLGENKKSYAITYTLSNPKKSLKDKEIDKIMNKIIARVQKELGGRLR